MSHITKVLQTGKTHTTVHGGARAGHHDKVDMTLSAVKGTAPQHVFSNVAAHPTAEQLFAGAWSACYTGALDLAAQAQQVQLPTDLSVEIEVDLAMSGSDYLLQARLTVRAPACRATWRWRWPTRPTTSALTPRPCAATSTWC